MKQNFLPFAVTLVALLLSPLQSLAAESSMNGSPGVSNKTKAAPKNVHSDKKRKAANIKLVDINNATREELKKLPEIGDVEADKIIAGRPYGSKANLVTKNVIDRAIYENLKKRVVAKQPYKNGAKNAALYNKKK